MFCASFSIIFFFSRTSEYSVIHQISHEEDIKYCGFSGNQGDCTHIRYVIFLVDNILKLIMCKLECQIASMVCPVNVLWCKYNWQQECIPVWCVPSTAVAVGEGVSARGSLPKGGCLPGGGGVCPGRCLADTPHGQNDKCLWKHYLATTTLRMVKMLILVPRGILTMMSQIVCNDPTKAVSFNTIKKRVTVCTHCTGGGPGPVQGPNGKYSIVPCRNAHTSPRQGQASGPIVFYCTSPTLDRSRSHKGLQFLFCFAL